MNKVIDLILFKLNTLSVYKLSNWVNIINCIIEYHCILIILNVMKVNMLPLMYVSKMNEFKLL